MVHLYDYIPKLFWPIYYFIQAPIQGLFMRGFEIDCRIKHFQGRVSQARNSNIQNRYRVMFMQILLVEDDNTLFQN